jgi:hypothetical protein
MKSQNDIIVSCVFGVVALVVIVLSFTAFKRQVVAPTPPTTVVTSDAPLPEAKPTMAMALPGGGGSGFGGGRGGAMGGGKSAMMAGMMGGGPPGVPSMARSGGGMGSGKAAFMAGMAGGNNK